MKALDHEIDLIKQIRSRRYVHMALLYLLSPE